MSVSKATEFIKAQKWGVIAKEIALFFSDDPNYKHRVDYLEQLKLKRAVDWETLMSTFYQGRGGVPILLQGRRGGSARRRTKSPLHYVNTGTTFYNNHYFYADNEKLAWAHILFELEEDAPELLRLPEVEDQKLKAPAVVSCSGINVILKLKQNRPNNEMSFRDLRLSLGLLAIKNNNARLLKVLEGLKKCGLVRLVDDEVKDRPKILLPRKTRGIFNYQKKIAEDLKNWKYRIDVVQVSKQE